MRSGGGGGFGSPLERPVDAVARDVRQGYVSPSAAREHYGVVIDAQTMDADIADTEQLRAAKATLEAVGGGGTA